MEKFYDQVYVFRRQVINGDCVDYIGGASIYGFYGGLLANCSLLTIPTPS